MADTPSTLTEEQAEASGRKDLLVFWLRMLGYICAGTVAPITTFAIKFGLFTEYGYTVTTDELGNVTGMNIALNGWGIISCVLVAYTAIGIIKDIIDSYSGYSFTKQCLTGLVKKIIPLVVGLFICYFLKGVLDQVMFCLGTLAICEIAAVPLNPMPAYKAKKQAVENYDDILEAGLKYIASKVKKEGK